MPLLLIINSDRYIQMHEGSNLLDLEVCFSFQNIPKKSTEANSTCLTCTRKPLQVATLAWHIYIRFDNKYLLALKF